MNRRTFLKYFFIFTSAYGVIGILPGHEYRGMQSEMADVKIKKYTGRIRPIGPEVNTEGKWIG